MLLDSRRTAYIAANFREFGDAALARVLGVGEGKVSALRASATLERSAEERAKLRDAGEDGAPVFTGQAPLPLGRVSLSRLDICLAVGCALVAFAVYLYTIGPTVTGEDSGELVSAAMALGVAHPPGYPLWCLLGKLFTLLPWGTVAWRVGLLSAVLGAAAVFVVALLIQRCCGNRWAATAGALALAFSGEFWEQNVIAEVYGLNSFLFVLCLWLLMNWYEYRRDRSLYLFAAMFGLSLTNHHTMLLQGPVFVFFVILIEPMFWRRWWVYALCTAIALCMLSVYLYLPIRSLANPAVDWGDPENPHKLWMHVARKQYSFGTNANPWSLWGTASQVGAFLKLYAWEYTPWIAWIPLVGAWRQLRRQPYHFALFGTACAAGSFGLIPLLNFKVDAQSLWLDNVFWIPAYIICGIWLGLGLMQIAEWFRPPSLRVAAPVALGIAAVLSPLLWHWTLNNKSDYWYAYDFGKNALETMEPNAIYFPAADHSTFPVMYLQIVDGLRPDVTLADKYGYPDPAVYAKMPEEMKRSFNEVPNGRDVEVIENWVIRNTDRPVYFTKPRSMGGLPGYQLTSVGLLLRVVRPGEKFVPEDVWAKYQWHTTDTNATHDELTANFVLSDYEFALARKSFAAGAPQEALEHLETSLRLSGRTKEGLNNAGSLCAEQYQLEKAVAYLKETLQADPEYVLALRNLGKVYLQMDDPCLGLVQFERIVKQLPEDLEAVRQSAICMRAIGWDDDAIGRYEYLLQLSPKDSVGWHDLGYLYAKKGDQEKAQDCFKRSLSLNPNQVDLKSLMGETPPTPEDLKLPTAQPQVPRGRNPSGMEGILPAMPRAPLPQLPTASGLRPK